MQLVIFDGDSIFDVIGIPDVGVEVDMETRSVRWQGGEIGGINVSFVVVPNDADTSSITPELIEADLKDSLKPWKLVVDEGISECRERLDQLGSIISEMETLFTQMNDKISELEQRITALEQSGAPPEGLE
jgi:hypothetical protein